MMFFYESNISIPAGCSAFLKSPSSRIQPLSQRRSAMHRSYYDKMLWYNECKFDVLGGRMQEPEAIKTVLEHHHFLKYFSQLLLSTVKSTH